MFQSWRYRCIIYGGTIHWTQRSHVGALSIHPDAVLPWSYTISWWMSGHILITPTYADMRESWSSVLEKTCRWYCRCSNFQGGECCIAAIQFPILYYYTVSYYFAIMCSADIQFPMSYYYIIFNYFAVMCGADIKFSILYHNRVLIHFAVMCSVDKNCPH